MQSNSNLVKCVKGPFCGELKSVTSLQEVPGGQYVFDKTVSQVEQNGFCYDVYRWKPYSDRKLVRDNVSN